MGEGLHCPLLQTTCDAFKHWSECTSLPSSHDKSSTVRVRDEIGSKRTRGDHSKWAGLGVDEVVVFCSAAHKAFHAESISLLHSNDVPSGFIGKDRVD